jgi:hypothetical protein
VKCRNCNFEVDPAAEACERCAEPLPDPERANCEEYVHCAGLFVDGHTLAVTRCDSCQRFETDFDAAACAHALIDLLRRVGRQLYKREQERRKRTNDPDDALSVTVADALDELVKRAHVEDEPEQLHPATDFGPIVPVDLSKRPEAWATKELLAWISAAKEAEAIRLERASADGNSHDVFVRYSEAQKKTVLALDALTQKVIGR